MRSPTQSTTEVLVLGAGAAGMGAALAAARKGRAVTLVERLPEPGGILNQCIHNGFGLHYFRQELTGPEYAFHLSKACEDAGIRFLPHRFLLDIHPHKRQFTFVSPQGVETLECRSFVWAAGARERPFGSLLIPGDRVSGIFTAGVAQRLVNLENRRPGNRAVILGSGDIGLIMARRLHLEGIEVVAVLERQSYPGGLERNLQQCLRDFDIPLRLSTTVAEVRGRGRLEEVTIVEVDAQFNPIRGTERTLAVDTLILSVGLVPSTTPVMGLFKLDPRSRGVVTDNRGRTSRDWCFSAGNCVGIYDLADWVTTLGQTAGESAAQQAEGQEKPEDLTLTRGEGAGVLLPSRWARGTDLQIFVRPTSPLAWGRVVVFKDGKVVKASRPRPLTPGEMEEMEIPSADLEGAQEIKVEVRHES